MLSSVQKEIKADRQIKKFCAYGFLKDLRFFEPYLLLFLMGRGMSLMEIGILIAVREFAVNIFEIPSGIIADLFGRKKELCLCFIFYIISFVCFFLTGSFITAAFAMVFFGLGEAFRSGTHKAMIYTYLDEKLWQKEKAFVYGRTRSFSLIGNAVSSLLSIALVLLVPSVNYIFLFAVVPYILDLLLILSYPDSLDTADKVKKSHNKNLYELFKNEFKQNKMLKSLLMENGIFDFAISYIKDLIQPAMEAVIIGSGVTLLASLSEEENLKITLGIMYACLSLFGSFASKKSYAVRGKKSSLKCLFLIHGLLGLSMAFLTFAGKNPLLIFLIYLFIYGLFNVRKPIFIDELDDHMEKGARATVLSISSQLKSVLLMVFAPLLGFLADNLGISAVMGILSVLFLLTLPLLKKRDVKTIS